jgi:hypothetical protein
MALGLMVGVGAGDGAGAAPEVEFTETAALEADDAAAALVAELLDRAVAVPADEAVAAAAEVAAAVVEGEAGADDVEATLPAEPVTVAVPPPQAASPTAPMSPWAVMARAKRRLTIRWNQDAVLIYLHLLKKRRLHKRTAPGGGRLMSITVPGRLKIVNSLLSPGTRVRGTVGP